VNTKKRVLFLCTGNSARSQMAEGILRHIAGDKFAVFSAGTSPKGVHPMTVEVMRDIDIDISGQRSKSVEEFENEKFDYVITVCDRAKQACPVFPGSIPMHWGFDDPAEEANPTEQRAIFMKVRNEIAQRLRLFVSANRV